jgi:putative transcriptional regulator
MTKEAFDTIAAGLVDAIAYARGDKSRGKARVVEVPTIDVAAMRKKLGLSQDRFAAAFGVSPSTVRNWEQGRRHPEGPAKVLLRVIDKEPEAVLRALHAS